MCPYGYRGNKCETHEFLDDENGEKTVELLPLFHVPTSHLSFLTFYSPTQNVIYQKTLRAAATAVRTRLSVPANV